ncbi:MAG: NAD(P)H-dependent oxidoreductase [Thermoanaerobaculia bacterium]|nr:NAD(P)H-dependent oxidoreductase [Thermoanaerobaculia bacterium]
MGSDSSDREPRILAFAGSTRNGSYNKRLVRIAARGARQAGARVTVADLADFPMPLFDADLEARSGMPEPAARFKRLMVESDGLLISSPEYNSSVTGVLKNAIDWASRREEGEPRLAAFAGKTAALMAASPGALGGLRGLVHLRAILGNLSVLVLPQQRAVSRAASAFTDDDELADEEEGERIEGLGRRLAEVVAALHAAGVPSS